MVKNWVVTQQSPSSVGSFNNRGSTATTPDTTTIISISGDGSWNASINQGQTFAPYNGAMTVSTASNGSQNCNILAIGRNAGNTADLILTTTNAYITDQALLITGGDFSNPASVSLPVARRWQHIVSDGNRMFMLLSTYDGTDQVGIISTDGGQTWIQCGNLNPSPSTPYTHVKYAPAYTTGGNTYGPYLFLLGRIGYVYCSTVANASTGVYDWSSNAAAYFGGCYAMDMAVSPVNGMIWFLYYDGYQAPVQVYSSMTSIGTTSYVSTALPASDTGIVAAGPYTNLVYFQGYFMFYAHTSRNFFTVKEDTTNWVASSTVLTSSTETYGNMIATSNRVLVFSNAHNYSCQPVAELRADQTVSAPTFDQTVSDTTVTAPITERSDNNYTFALTNMSPPNAASISGNVITFFAAPATMDVVISYSAYDYWAAGDIVFANISVIDSTVMTVTDMNDWPTFAAGDVNKGRLYATMAVNVPLNNTGVTGEVKRVLNGAQKCVQMYFSEDHALLFPNGEDY